MVLHDFETGLKGPDHFPLVVDFAWISSVMKRMTPHKPLDRKKLRDPLAQDKFKSLLDTIPQRPWHTELNAHAAEVVSDINTVAQQAFEIDPKRARQPYIDTSIHALIQLRRAIRKVLMRNQGENDVTANLRLTALADKLLTGWLVSLAQDSKKLHWHHFFMSIQGAAHKRRRATLDAFSFTVSLQVFLHCSEGPLQTAIENARCDFLEKRAGDIQIALDQKQNFAEWQAVKALLKNGGRRDRPKQGAPPLPSVCDEHGNTLLEDADIASHVQEHFASVELGWQATSEQLVQAYNPPPPCPGHYDKGSACHSESLRDRSPTGAT